MHVMKIAIVKLSALGDIVHTMVVLQFLKKHHPNIVIDWVIEARFSGVLVGNPHINQIHSVNLKQVKQQKSWGLLLSEVRKIKRLGAYDLVIDAQGLVKSAIVARLIPSKQTWGFDRDSIRESFAAYFYSHTVAIAYHENIIKRNVMLFASALNMQINEEDILNKSPFLFSKNSEKSHQIVLVLGASFVSKQYPIVKFSQLIEALGITPIAIWGNDKEYQLASDLKALAPSVQISKKLNLGALIGVIKNADLVIGGDTGPTHMAWALNVASITLFGSTPGYRNTYQTKINKIIESKSEVNPDKINKNDRSIQTIEVDNITDMAKELLLLTD